MGHTDEAAAFALAPYEHALGTEYIYHDGADHRVAVRPCLALGARLSVLASPPLGDDSRARALERMLAQPVDESGGIAARALERAGLWPREWRAYLLACSGEPSRVAVSIPASGARRHDLWPVPRDGVEGLLDVGPLCGRYAVAVALLAVAVEYVSGAEGDPVVVYMHRHDAATMPLLITPSRAPHPARWALVAPAVVE